ncbi:NADH-quinone oxidoreductase subunit M [Chitinophagaceae bacterium LB-8]|uniref:NADH-quinone oxidoreductase subunit M n=1 Tax=Paraflavisolibacter caeni TaxID=2982496 RepID=A0A9X2XPB3_9BACT|nr:NADH-quinone oxidoreductase subunit M [Paraflavisolibacter caeni]MCU7550873.1 NADH-quinone oxidoreductase subunit M [Paraflavisolibacter caeni]
MNLTLLIIAPLITAVTMLLMRNAQQVKWTSLVGSAIQLVLAFALLFVFQNERSAGNTEQMLFQQNYTWFSAWNIHFHVGVDGISVAMILLTAFVVIAGVLVSWNVQKMVKEFYLMLILLSIGAYGFFLSLDLFLLFFFLEIAVLPKFLLIGIWGSGEKEYSANKLALMLMGGSALVLVGLLGVYFAGSERTFDLLKLSRLPIPQETQRLLFPLLFAGFGVFTALFPFHTWVPDGHSSAPTAGSMFLAGISMKLGGYGCLRVATYILPEGAKEYSTIIIALAAIAILYGAFATMMQKDLKYINAYSSVSHCGFVLLGIGMLTKTAITGAVIQMVSHGLMTALFFAVIGMIYDRTHTRSVKKLGGLLKVMPFITTIFFIVGLCSLGLPGFSGFVAEMTVFMGSWERPEIPYRVATIAACMSIVVTAVYILRAIGQTAMGPVTEERYMTLKDASWNEKLAAVILITGIVVIGVAPFWLNDLVAPGAHHIIEKISQLNN